LIFWIKVVFSIFGFFWLFFGKESVLHTRNYLSAKDLRQMNGCSTFFATDKGGHFFSRATPVQNRHRGRLARLKPPSLARTEKLVRWIVLVGPSL
jgi:hypothetical protein